MPALQGRCRLRTRLPCWADILWNPTARAGGVARRHRGLQRGPRQHPRYWSPRLTDELASQKIDLVAPFKTAKRDPRPRVFRASAVRPYPIEVKVSVDPFPSWADVRHGTHTLRYRRKKQALIGPDAPQTTHANVLGPALMERLVPRRVEDVSSKAHVRLDLRQGESPSQHRSISSN